MNVHFTVDEVERHLHPTSPRLGQSCLTGLSYRIGMQRVISIELAVVLKDNTSHHFFFDEVWTYGIGVLSVPEPIDAGILILDVKDRGWECPLVIIADDERFTLLFGAAIAHKLPNTSLLGTAATHDCPHSRIDSFPAVPEL